MPENSMHKMLCIAVIALTSSVHAMERLRASLSGISSNAHDNKQIYDPINSVQFTPQCTWQEKYLPEYSSQKNIKIESARLAAYLVWGAAMQNVYPLTSDDVKNNHKNAILDFLTLHKANPLTPVNKITHFKPGRTVTCTVTPLQVAIDSDDKITLTLLHPNPTIRRDSTDD